MGITLFDKDFIKLAEKMGVKDEQSKILLRDLVSAYLYINDLKDIGGINWVVETLLSLTAVMIALEPLIDILREDDSHAINENLIESVCIPWGLQEMVSRINEIITHLIPAMESAGYAQRKIWEMKLTVINRNF